MASNLFDDEQYRKILEVIKSTMMITPEMLHVDWAKTSSETAFVFGRKMAEELRNKKVRTKVRTGPIRIQWEHNVRIPDIQFPDIVCGTCGYAWDLHDKDGECPDIIDAQFKPDEPPLLPSGEEE